MSSSPSEKKKGTRKNRKIIINTEKEKVVLPQKVNTVPDTNYSKKSGPEVVENSEPSKEQTSNDFTFPLQSFIDPTLSAIPAVIPNGPLITEPLPELVSKPGPKIKRPQKKVQKAMSPVNNTENMDEPTKDKPAKKPRAPRKPKVDKSSKESENIIPMNSTETPTVVTHTDVPMIVKRKITKPKNTIVKTNKTVKITDTKPKKTTKTKKNSAQTTIPENTSEPPITASEIKKIDQSNENIDESNKELFQQELDEYNDNANYSDDNKYDFLYPTLNDPNFIEKLSKHKEFYDTRYDGTIHPIEKQANILCNSSFELLPHQLFVKNFLSLQTPYNSLLLYHGLGSGKTCSAIGIAEEMRSYMKQLNITKRILVIASPNVQANFRLQLFDESKLEYIQGKDATEGIWNINSCVGNALIKEINPTNLKGLPRERVISSIKRIINNFYLFMGYIQLSNYIFNAIKKSTNIENLTKQQRKKLLIKHIRDLFDNRLIIIDEVHNIRISDDNQERKKTALLLMKVAKYAQNLRLLLLSATPMFNSHQEIIWLTNLMNINDKRATIEIGDVFDSAGGWKPAKKLADGTMKEDGKSLLIRKLTGYISYVRGENPYTFPYRVYPSQYAESKYVLLKQAYPTTQMNGSPLSQEDAIKYIDIYVNRFPSNSVQYKGYKRILEEMHSKSTDQYTAMGKLRRMPAFEDMESFGYTSLQLLIESLNMVYPHPSIVEPARSSKKNETKSDTEESEDEEEYISKAIVGETGLRNTMNFVEETQNMMQMRHKFSYKPDILEKYGRIFSPSLLRFYSSKIDEICHIIRESTGIIMIYSQYIDGGLVPMALALEEMGFSRFGSNPNTTNLFETPPTDQVDYEMKPKQKDTVFHSAKYVMITGDKAFSPNNAADIKHLTSKENKDGKNIRVVLLSRAGAEGLDFKNIRQVHIMEPWYNMNRIEQIVGRAVRNLSHCQLPFKKRNVEIYLHATSLPNNSEESVDMYVYRYAEKKAVQIGEVTRLLKTIAVDCFLNIGQTNFSVERLLENVKNQKMEITLSRYDQDIPFLIGDRPHSEMCDYMNNCEFVCSPMPDISPENIQKENYNNTFVQSNQDRIIKRIRELFRDKMPEPSRETPNPKPHLFHVYFERDHLINAINIVKEYPIEQIFSALSVLIHNKNEYLIDAYGRTGRLIDKYNENTDTAYYVFQPIELTDENASIYERTTPIEYKRKTISLEIDKSELPISRSETEPDAENSISNASPQSTEGEGEPEIQASKKPLKQLPKNPTKVPKQPSEPINPISSNSNTFQAILKQLNRCLYGELVGNEEITGLVNTRVLQKGEKNWYVHAGMVYHYSKPENQYEEIKKTKEEDKAMGRGRGKVIPIKVEITKHNLPIQQIRSLFGITDELFQKYIIHHFMDSLLFEEKLAIIRHFYSENREPSSPEEKIMKSYLDERILKKEDQIGMLTVKDDTLILIIQNAETGEWIEGDQEDYALMGGELRRFQIDRTPESMFFLLGFITPFVSKKTNTREMVFKVKDMTEKRNNIGARIDDAGKDKVIKLLNALVETPNYYNDTNTAFINQLGICITIEIIMRKFSEDKRMGKYYYLTPEQAILSDIIKKSFST